ncbi:MAG: exodeoxyribonuclease VII small subunit [Candidatus Subteraquimicrobiales bacterium]|nr:exodeoxyribonuclease VII small subunit [Candidatus Subteraquimicrobiales bacterium]
MKKDKSDEVIFKEAIARLEEIASQIKMKDVSLEKSLELLEEGVRLANVCTEKIDKTVWHEDSEEQIESANKEESDLS